MVSSTETNARPRSRISVLLRGLDTFIDLATGFVFIFGAVAMFAMVVTRYGFSYSDPSVEIIVRYCMIWGTFIGVAAAVRFGVNIRFTLLEHLFGDKGRRIIQTVANVITLLLALGLTVSGYTLADETLMFDERMPTALRWPVWPFHSAIFVGGCILSIQIVRSIVTLWQPGGESGDEPAVDTPDAGVA